MPCLPSRRRREAIKALHPRREQSIAAMKIIISQVQIEVQVIIGFGPGLLEWTGKSADCSSRWRRALCKTQKQLCSHQQSPRVKEYNKWKKETVKNLKGNQDGYKKQTKKHALFRWCHKSKWAHNIMIWIADQNVHYSDAIWFMDHSAIKQILPIWIPDWTVIQIPTVKWT